jgi:hypothetical protein
MPLSLLVVAGRASRASKGDCLRVLVIMPALNEADSLSGLIVPLRQHEPIDARAHRAE